jgi:plastocyanin
MRVTSMVAGLALVLAACGGGEKKAGEAAQPADTSAAAAAAPAGGGAAAPATGGAKHDVNMELVGTTYKYDPSAITIKPGDQVVFHDVSGGPHNVQFYPDSIPSGAQSAINMPDPMGPLASPLLTEPNATYTVTFAASAPKGDYHFYCLPHQALGMKGKITVQ